MKYIKKVLFEENEFNLDFDKEVSRCDGCNCEWRSDEGIVTSGGIVYCGECAKDLIKCTSCGCWVTEDALHGIGNRYYYCKDCAEEFDMCDYCGSVIDEDDAINYRGDILCYNCLRYELGGFLCSRCGEPCSDEDGEVWEDGERYCYDCIEYNEQNTWSAD